MLKYNGSQKYTTDGYSAAIVRQICNTWEIPLQTFANRSDIAGGSTLGNISTAHVSIPSADVGLAQLAMHSAMETASCKDAEYMAKAVAEFYNTPISQPVDGEWKLDEGNPNFAPNSLGTLNSVLVVDAK